MRTSGLPLALLTTVLVGATADEGKRQQLRSPVRFTIRDYRGEYLGRTGPGRPPVAVSGTEWIAKPSPGVPLDAALVEARRQAFPGLDLSERRLTPAALQRIGTLTHLRSLEIAGEGLDHRLAAPLLGMARLERLWLRRCAWLRSAAPLSQLSGLTHLGLEACQLTGGLETLSRLPHLRELRLTSCSVDARTLAPLSTLRGLRVLDLRHIARLDAEAVRIVAQLPLIELQLDCNPQLGSRALQPLGRMAALRHLTLNGSDGVDGAVLQRLAGLSLETLGVGSCPAVNDAAMRHLARIASLRTLCLDGSPVTDAGLRHLTRLPDLRELWLDNDHLTAACLPTLKAMPALREVWLSLNVGRDAAAIRRQLPGARVHHPTDPLGD